MTSPDTLLGPVLRTDPLSSLNEDQLDLPDLSAPYALPAGASERYWDDGYAVVRGIVTPEEVSTYRRVIAEAAQRFNPERRALDERDTYGKAFLQTGNLWLRDEAVRRFTLARRFARIAADLIGVNAVRLYHDQALFKEAGGGFTPWHQDQYYWPLEDNKCITMWMPLVDVDDSMGIMQFARGSHRFPYLQKLAISDESEAEYERWVQTNALSVEGPTWMAAGDATFHNGWTLHRAPPNHSPRQRDVMTIIYVADGVRVCAPDNPNRKHDLDSFLPDREPGQLAASHLMPLLYSRE